MGELVTWELQYMAVVITTGIFLAVCYDAIRIFRRIIPHGIFWISVEDILFWMAVSLVTFVVCFVEDAGNIRWFAVFGEILGAYMYHLTVSPFLVKYISLLLFFPVKLLKKALKKIKKSFKISRNSE